jgi:3-hydroxyacyl-CoA dehydrogenase
LKISEGYEIPRRNKIKVAGKDGITKLEKYIQENKKARKWSRKKVKLLQKAAYVFCGGNVEKSTQLDEQQLLDLEKEYFLKLCGERYTLHRMNKILQGKK